MTLRLAWFASARGNGSRLLFNSARQAIEEGSLNAEIACVFCNREPGQSPTTDVFFEDVKAAGIPLITKSSGAWRKRVNGETSDPAGNLAPWRRDYDKWIRDQIEPHSPHVAFLAGYMLVVTDALCDALPMLNLHPAPPGGPEGTWQQVITRLIESGAGESGLQLQRVTTQLDRGPVVTSCTYPIRGPQFDHLWSEQPDPSDQSSHLFRAIRDAGVAREQIFLIESLREYAKNPICSRLDVDVSAAVEDVLPLELAPAPVGEPRRPSKSRPRRPRRQLRPLPMPLA